jgi:LmbE family N-acetylglucosaminyl deacetylase
MAEKANRGVPVAVAVATDGRQGWYSPTPRPAPRDIAEIRHREWHQALDALAVSRADRFELHFPDGQLNEHGSELADRIGELFRRVRPSQVFVTRPGDPHPDHRILAQAVRQAMAQIYDSGPGVSHGGVADGAGPRTIGPPPQVFTYRVYPGEGLWPDGRPSQVTVGTAVMQFARSVLGLAGRRALLLRAPGSMPTKMAAIDAYDSQRRLLGGELSYVWATGVELYWPMDGHGSEGSRGPGEPSI